MKRTTIIILVLLLAGVAIAAERMFILNRNGEIINPDVQTERAAWEVLSAVLDAGDEPNDLAVDERTYATVLTANEGGDSKITTFTLFDKPNWENIRIRGIGITNEQDTIYQIYFGTLGSASATDCELVKVAQLTFKTGTQVSTTADYEMADTLTTSDASTWSQTLTTKSPTGELVAEFTTNLAGADLIVVVQTTVPANAKLLIKGF